MVKKELIKVVAQRTEQTQVLTEKMVDAVLECICETLGKGEEIRLMGFGSWEIKNRKAKVGQNPKTGEKIDIPAKKAVSFKCGKLLKDAVAELPVD